MSHQPRLPHGPQGRTRGWILAGGVGLAALAGYVNVLALGVFAVPVSHMTGAVSRLGIDVATGNREDLWILVFIVLCFFLGAALSGAVIGGDQLIPGRRYGVTLVGEALALAGAAELLGNGGRGGVLLAALACGIQNGMASSYYGMIIRTTHVTGIVTDLGVLAGHRLRGHRVSSWQPILLLGLLFGFTGGAVAGQLALVWRGPEAMWAASGACLVTGLGYYGWRHRTRRRSTQTR